MKKALWLLPVAILALCACSKSGDDEDENTDNTDNKVTIGTETLTFDTTNSELDFYDDYYSFENENWGVYLALSGNMLLYLDITTPVHTTNPTHTYTFCTEAEAEAGKTWGLVGEECGYGPSNEEEESVVTAGSLNVSYDTTSEVYTINIDCKLSDGRTVKGRYKGKLSMS